MRLSLRVCQLLLGGLCATPDWVNAQSPPAAIAAAVLPLPASLRAGAGVVALGPGGQPRTLRPSTNGMVCIADEPGDSVFGVECNHVSILPIAYRMRQLAALRASNAEIDRTIEAEIRSGALKLPSGPTTTYVMYGPLAGYDSSTNTVSNAISLGHLIHLPYATAAAAGLPLADDGVHPYLMENGRYYAHVMVPASAPVRPMPCVGPSGLRLPAADSRLSLTRRPPPSE